ncbi:MAG: tRNA (adenosine(37)-N6)-threonylcarbamoyltransferase complex dimerization subunit type 1 TsaB [Microbacterium sp.]|uniref:tRNA (adenosine(37)-N6)-threonylcarbamoyltransferase complex dimerization subunit type 1 TsaB n=1 Tax=Microbacterium sp. TaxID=51671 RepID=UPI000DB592B1|nr:tRNA (adenosine(37)-N6)-threonylcarbamoyltransferase complex dimerization subunit type 1 TsaB [Microbacterium sp.]PZU38092.1 MAG: tRNA (adenosine(37)-N6)-threonylcarbamoyltransferase complex dimerization subunit type 1 TsaB [Microbacterium sp.]
MILAIDTSLGTAVAVVTLDGEVRGEASTPNALGHAEIIGDLLERALDAAAATPADITHVAAGMGPGPFTGLRIGIAAARAFALGRRIPIVPVASHDAAALTHFDRPGIRGPIAITTDARRREFAYTIYAGIDERGLPIRTAEPALAPRDELDARLAGAGAATVDDATDADADADADATDATDATAADAASASPTRIDVTEISAAALGRVAARQIASDAVATASEPLYLRSPDVTVGGPRKRVGT